MNVSLTQLCVGLSCQLPMHVKLPSRKRFVINMGIWAF